MTLKGKNIVIVGGTSGMGLSACQACIQAGAKVSTFGRNAEKVERSKKILGNQATIAVGNATDPNMVSSVIDRFVAKQGIIHGLYHVAGGSGRSMGDAPLHEVTDKGWYKTIELNLTSMFYSNRAAVRQFLRQKTRGSILNMGSVLGFSPSSHYFGTLTYATAKSAIIGMTKSSASFYADQGIRFNVIAPALVDTPMAERASTNQKIMQYIQTKQPLDGGRIGLPSDLNQAVVFFLSDASKFVTGQVLAIDGGWSISEGQYL